ncbi:BsaA family SipW-dependent biofilm matrix protein [Candidatus Saccharibacteria bacterium]|nr:BsaA family SipW-dependent biofilm matrix protein [Candidatus Saccharibacteria bacterium]
MKKLQKKKNIAAVAALGMFVLVGVTVAYHTSTGAFRNIFKLGYWQNETTEVFDIPNDWQPCQEIPKTVIGKNTGTVPAVVRLKYEEYWKAAGSTSTDHISELSLVDGNSNKIASVNLQNQSDWVDGGDGWYYYRYTIKPQEETNSLLKSVTLDCRNDFGGINDVCTVDGNTRSCTRLNDDYEDASFHVFVTVQYLQEDECDNVWGHCTEPQYHANCNSNRLYDTIACQTNGPDTNVDFKQFANRATGNGNGVNTLAAHQNDFYPIYYYRGELDNNYVVLNDICWQIIRTTSSGGVKLIYGAPATISNGVAICDGRPSNYTGIGQSYYNTSHGSTLSGYTGLYASPSDAGFVHGDSYNVEDLVMYSDTRIYFGNDVTYDGSKYHLVDVISGFTRNNIYADAADGHHYFCPNYEDSCEEVYYGTYFANGGSKIFAIRLTHGEDIEEAKRLMFEKQTAPSDVYWTIANWFGSNMRRAASKLEATTYCNDRSIWSGSLVSKDFKAGTDSSQWGEWAYDMNNNLFGGYKRVSIDAKPSIDCQNDSHIHTGTFGMITADEAMLGGARAYLNTGTYADINANSTSYWLNVYWTSHLWTLTPSALGYDHMYQYALTNLHLFEEHIVTGGQLGGEGAVRPVVSLKPGTEFASGNGTPNSPYYIEI